MKIYLRAEEIYEGNLILVNLKHPIKASDKKERFFRPFASRQEIQLEKGAGRKLKKLLAQLPDSRKITGVSGYRPLEEQRKLFETSLFAHGKDYTEAYVALPNHSEHQTGLAIDLAEDAPEIDFICPKFPYEGVCQQFREQAWEYGFIERYPKEKEKITGIGAEPWHFRYVGTPHAQIMKEHGFVLEEYIEWMKQFTKEKPLQAAETEIYYARFHEAEKGLEIGGGRSCSISGNNVDGFIVTLAGA